MRRTASEIIRNLEQRIARLEKQSSRTSELETLKKLLQIPLGKARYVRDDDYYYFSGLRGEVKVLSDVVITPDYENDYEGKVRSYMIFNVGSLINGDVDVRKVQSELEKEVKRLISKSSLLKEKAREEMNEEVEADFTSNYEDGRFYAFSYASDGDVQVSVEVKKEKEPFKEHRNWLRAKIKISQEFDFEQKGEY